MKRSKYIDHTLLKPDTTKEQIIQLCKEAKEYDFASVCVNPCWIETARKELAGSDVNVCVVIGFPLGAMTSASKVFEAKDAIERGADEVDMVLNVGWLKDGDDAAVTNEIKAVKEAVGSHVLKVIIEACLLTNDEKVRACQDAEKAGADFVKTSTGFSTGGATVEDVALMKKTVGDRLKVKAAGGIRTKEAMDAMIAAGAERIGTSNGTKLM
ncbi:deoxyribose-phosphate aldolase [Stecheria sp. CLA-KB-P133]|uniref:Deoxyribose-phosphate aldolase n=1 Tax=Grylomicrobium aquisgranensis TaxID=2926318 RepID=A0AB35U765_9FIRM|nr:deoxyribose-phosphate aldolase [Lactimicrobium massiliense]MDD6458599.1 deoxyribose-phosphate aldolase [Lactimicrobium massiliense]MDD6674037.1 deoxyribose-phosphate aldolase [Lactimicrobium massiliense]MDD6727059.1 deoxyribose-phosphate aldolase [Lactimicrobium massiliense]MDX8419100.1 deoxyribose-phosphate aldolase [Stecheria sp. CLA-KB-P133]